MKNILIVGLALFLFAGCSGKSNIQFDSSSNDLDAKRFKVKENTANIYLYTDDEVTLPTSINGQFIGTLINDSYFKLEVKPGKYVVETFLATILMVNNQKVTIDAKKDSNYFIEYDVGMIPANGTLKIISYVDGREGVEENNLLTHRKFDNKVAK